MVTMGTSSVFLKLHLFRPQESEVDQKDRSVEELPLGRDDEDEAEEEVEKIVETIIKVIALKHPCPTLYPIYHQLSIHRQENWRLFKCVNCLLVLWPTLCCRCCCK